ncbi:MAG: CoA-binding protein [Candidatus Hydrogenedentes bacterium]|nr:CoA-binding protein [Candidatus Hydrogenedentota bacterium]
MSIIVIVGASKNRKKFGNKAVRAFLQGGWTVYPVNPTEAEIEGVKSYSSIDDVPEPVDRVTLYVAPEVGIKLLEQIAAKKPTEFFLNPGSESPALIEAAEKLGLEPILACSVVNIGLRPEMFSDE